MSVKCHLFYSSGSLGQEELDGSSRLKHTEIFKKRGHWGRVSARKVWLRVPRPKPTPAVAALPLSPSFPLGGADGAGQILIILARGSARRSQGEHSWDSRRREATRSGPQVIHLRQKEGFFLRNFPLYTYSLGQRVLDVPPSQGCYYEGYVEGDPSSLVALSTCSGLRGLLAVQAASYGLEPVERSARFEHILYREDPAPGGTCSLAEREIRRHEAGGRGRAGKAQGLGGQPAAWTHKKYLELFLVVTKLRFTMSESNVTKTTQLVLEVLNIVHSHLQQLHLELVLIGLEIWTEKDLVDIADTMPDTQENFNRWRIKDLYWRVPHDLAHLFTGKNYGKTLGRAYIGGVCTYNSAAGVDAFWREDILRFAGTVSHEIGHNLGMQHDTLSCRCGDGGETLCLMFPNVLVNYKFSNCSVQYFYDLLRDGEGECLFDRPAASRVFGGQRCGNRVVEAGEACDCGDPAACWKDPCCLPTCQLRPGVDCASGPCCHGCRFQKAGVLCRGSVDVCDLPEYCNGTSRWCQPDAHKQDGSPCRDRDYCYRGRCRSHGGQCARLFGPGAEAARDGCYRHVNTAGDRFGNCGVAVQGLKRDFSKCRLGDVLCGRLQCENVRRLPRMGHQHTLVQFPLEGSWCWGMDPLSPVDAPDEGAVEDGTLCGPGRVCLNHTCANASLLGYDCDPAARCHGRGVCNNFKNCHCRYGFAPPRCELKGFGGSVDSGPAPERASGLRSTLLWTLLTLGLVFAAIFIIAFVKRRQVREACNRARERLRRRLGAETSQSVGG
ncbi:disintegrin and metalloproteinase domain-containing protein 1a-like [Ornithorhynchus anatinus]|uniref:disintegrin and metalloproteinase domain-containing protein 1a-like n=1 Tax=Ornithorhynchus anatinus TaxID=9258 RepID=UPI0010A84F06|nr:disintegrin and metalloproteinase domain-containing protein 1a-like [Ornithorhynchus anatinus]